MEHKIICDVAKYGGTTDAIYCNITVFLAIQYIGIHLHSPLDSMI